MKSVQSNSIIPNPVIHDKSDAIRFGSPNSGSALVNDKDWTVEIPNPFIRPPSSHRR